LVEKLQFLLPLPSLLHPFDRLLGTSHLGNGGFLSFFCPWRLLIGQWLECTLFTIFLEFIVYGVFVRGLLDFLKVFAELIKVDALVACVGH
jgi:hypothetical protein